MKIQLSESVYLEKPVTEVQVSGVFIDLVNDKVTFQAGSPISGEIVFRAFTG